MHSASNESETTKKKQLVVAEDPYNFIITEDRRRRISILKLEIDTEQSIRNIVEEDRCRTSLRKIDMEDNTDIPTIQVQ